MSFKIIWDKKAQKELEKLNILVARRIIIKIRELQEDPFRFLKHLENIDGYKLRIGDYRLIIDVDKTNSILTILKLGHRKNIYD